MVDEKLFKGAGEVAIEVGSRQQMLSSKRVG